MLLLKGIAEVILDSVGIGAGGHIGLLKSPACGFRFDAVGSGVRSREVVLVSSGLESQSRLYFIMNEHTSTSGRAESLIPVRLASFGLVFRMTNARLRRSLSPCANCFIDWSVNICKEKIETYLTSRTVRTLSGNSILTTEFRL